MGDAAAVAETGPPGETHGAVASEGHREMEAAHAAAHRHAHASHMLGGAEHLAPVAETAEDSQCAHAQSNADNSDASPLAEDASARTGASDGDALAVPSDRAGRPSLDYKELAESVASPSCRVGDRTGEFIPAHVPGRAVMADSSEGDAAAAHDSSSPRASHESAQPSAPQDVTKYKVQANDTVVSIAVRFGITVWELCTYNRMASKVVFPGETIKIPRPGEVVSRRSAPRDDQSHAHGDERPPSVSSLKQSEALSTSSPDVSSIDAPSASSAASAPRARSSSDEPPRGRATSTGQPNPPTLRRRASIDVEEVHEKEDGTVQYHVKYITEGKGVVGGVLVMSIDRFSFVPSADDPIVLELGPEEYELDGPIGAVCNCSVHESLTRLRQGDESSAGDGGAADDSEAAGPSVASTQLPMYLKVGVVAPEGEARDHVFAVSRKKIDMLYASLLQFMSDAEFVHGEQFMPMVIGTKARTPRKRSFVDELLGEDHPEPPVFMQSSKLLDLTDMLKIIAYLPKRHQRADWNLIYSTHVHGISLRTFYRNMDKHEGPSVLVVSDSAGAVFGAFVTEPFRMSETFYGSGESFLFSVKPQFAVYHWSHDNDFFMMGRPDCISVGGGGGSFGLWLDADFNHGSSHPCTTFRNPTISSTCDFTCVVVEAWGFVNW